MLAPSSKLFSAPGWLFELTYDDGFRCLAWKRGDVVRLESRIGREMAPCFPELVDALRAVPADVARGNKKAPPKRGR
jgi:ATP-dependent DNA ligase